MAEELIAAQRIAVETADRAQLVAHRFRSARPLAVAVIGPALGVRQDFYFDFARYLASRGVDACTFDYRGVGHSAPRSLRRFRATVTEWAQQDHDAVLQHAHAAGPHAPLFVVGHSLGAQLPALTRTAPAIDAMVAVAGGSGYWRGLAPALRPLMLAMIRGVAPLAIPLAGCFPGSRLRMIGDLPAGVMRQWGRWCMHPEYLVGVEPGARDAYANARFEILSLSFSDDWMMPGRNIERLHAHFRAARRESRRITPAQAGGPVGHMGFFRRRHRDTLWAPTADWLLARTGRQHETTGDRR